MKKMNICDSGTLTDSDYNQRYIFNILLFTMEWKYESDCIYQAIEQDFRYLLEFLQQVWWNRNKMQVIFKILLSLPDKPAAFLSETVDATGFVSVLLSYWQQSYSELDLEESHQAISKSWKMYICSIAAVGKAVFHFICGSWFWLSIWKGVSIGAGLYQDN